ncbi:MAG: alanine racemase [Gammaproteobacteria bacterium]|jgi:alanine racemase|nr:alanine racemase [Gammaproteobacteria bacterium]
MTRPAKVIIDLAALRFNYSRVQHLAAGCKVMAVVKADAYGHGLVRVAKALSSADAFGVACLEEAEQLREAKITQPIVLLEGPYSFVELKQIEALDLDIVVHHISQLEMLEQSTIKKPIRVWLKLDSGMHRLGFDIKELASVWSRLQVCDSVANEIIMMTHLAAANEINNPMTSVQLDAFASACESYTAERTIANSAGIVGSSDSHADWVRPGLMLYGVSPMQDSIASDHNLQPVMSLESRLISVKNLNKGESVGYGASWRCPSDTTIGIVAAGYGDGFPRHAKSGTPTLVNGKRASIIGNASMDMLTVDLSAQPQAKVGDPVELWGTSLAIEEVASYADTIPYELLCGVHKRLAFVEKNG